MIIDNTRGPSYYWSALPVEIPKEDIPFYYISQEGDRFDTIATRFYKTPEDWWIIAKANNFNDGSIAVPPGTKLFIPNV